MSDTPALLLEAVLAIASRAAAVILEVYAAPFEAQSKKDGTPVTDADLQADAEIRAGLAALAPGIPLISEEQPPPPFTERHGWPRLWLVDPLDGTREFVRRSGQFTVNIALVDAGRPVLGVVVAPVSRIAWYAAAGSGAWKREGEAAPVRIHSRTCPPTPVVVASRSRGNQMTNTLLDTLGVHEPMRIGSSIKSCLVAEGSADIYPGFSRTSEWDTAAAQCVLEQAGGRLCDLSLRPLVYNRGRDLLNPRFLAVGDPRRDWAADLPPEPT